MNYFRCGGGSEKVTIDGVKVKDKLDLMSWGLCDDTGNDLPKSPMNRSKSATVYGGYAFALLESSNQYSTQNNGLFRSRLESTSWTAYWNPQNVFPPLSYGRNMVVLDDGIHFLGGLYVAVDPDPYNTPLNHYVLNVLNVTATKLSDLPVKVVGNPVVVLNNEIHILGSYSVSDQTKHYKWNGTTWTQVSTLPENVTSVSLGVVCNGEIHILQVNGAHYKWNGTTWTQVSTLPKQIDGGSTCVAYDGEIYVFFSNNSNQKDIEFLKWNGTSWVQSYLDSYSNNGMTSSPIVFNNAIYGFQGVKTNKIRVGEIYKKST